MKKEVKICMPYYKIAYSIAFVVILSAIQPVVYANEIGQAVERAVSLLAVVFCADTYLVEVQSKRSEVFCLYNLKKQAGVVYKRLFVQVAYLIGISLLAYGLFYWQKPVNLTEELDGGALFGIYCIAIPGTVLFWSVLSVTVSNLVRNRWIGMGVVLLFWFFSISGKATQFLKNWGPFSYGTCDFGKLTEWRWLGGKVLCVVFAGMMLAFVPKILKKRGLDDLTVTFKNGVTAVDHVDLEIPHGIFGLLGENGAGKTTLMRVLTTVLAPTSGKVLLDGTLYCEANYEKIQKKIGYLPQEIDLYPSLTVRECLEYMGDLAGIEKRESKKRIDYYLEKTSLAP